jgi:TetR/AcrR family transcriptional regulator, transcriptional repressor for nem operon
VAMTAGFGKSVRLTAKGQRTRQRIIEAAGRLIGRHGVTRMTLDDVRAEAAVSSSQIYHYFADKQSLISAVVDHQDALSVGQTSMLGCFESAEAMRLWAHQLIERQRDSHYGGSCPIATLGSGLAGMDGETLAQIARIFRRCEGTIRAGYRTMQANNEIAADVDTDVLATMTLATAIGGLVLAQLNRDTQALQVAMNALLDHLPLLPGTSPNSLRENIFGL